MRLLRYIYIIPCLLLSVLAEAQQWKTFSDSSITFTAKYPASWVNKIKEDKRVFFSSPSDGANDSFFENVNVGVTQNNDYGSKIKIKEVVPAVLDNLKTAFDEFKPESERYFTWNNTPACEIIYSGYIKTNPDLRVRMTQWFCFYKTRLYTVTFTALASNNKHNATAKKIMSSIIFK
ncbi:MAG: PsbP-related protein [Chitinophagaceae bacterium]